MIEEIKNIKLEKGDMRKFGITVGIILLMISALIFWKEKESFKYFFGVGILLLLSGIWIPFYLKKLYWLWMVLATILGWIMTRLILSLLFYLIITPMGLILRLFGKQFVELKWEKGRRTYWNYTPENYYEKENMKRQF
tara:strand:+ start:457 stop:870 length:414 start_codon:yes stop_codon:yes gene_type:complete